MATMPVMSNRIAVCALNLFFLLLPSLTARAADRTPTQLWLYYPANLLVEKNIDKLEEIWSRAAKAGYTHVLLADSKFSRLSEMDQRYFRNADRVKRIAADLKMAIVPALFSVGYSNDLLSRDPNLAEGLAVEDALFVVGGGVATLQADPPIAFNPKFAFIDESVKLDKAAGVATVTDNSSNARMNQRLKLTPHRHYHISVDVKTDNYTGQPEVKALAGGWSLIWTNLGVKRTQDWRTHHVTFNNFDNADVTAYFGIWGKASGTLQWRNWRIEEVGLLNVLRRPGAPVTVKLEEGGRTLEEGKDYEPIKDPRMGSVPWAGEYEVFHESPPIRMKGDFADGTRLRVSWYHPHIVYDGQVMICPSEPATRELLADQAKRMKQLWGDSAGGWMMSHDEIRCLNQDLACQHTGRTPGQILADNARFCTGLLRDSAKPMYVWNDMFDPYHNAVKGPYYLVNGTYDGAWEGLDKSVVVVNWNFGKRDQSLKFFADRGHKQVIAGYYDHKPEQVKDWLDSAKGVEGVVGVMYTTWRNDYSNMETFAKRVTKP
jgi:hypothetical protein